MKKNVLAPSLGIAVILASLGLLSVQAEAATISYSHTIAPKTVNYSEDFFLSKFDTSLGTLTSITLSALVEGQAEIDIFNGTSSDQSFQNATATVPFSVTTPIDTLNASGSVSIASGTNVLGMNTFSGLPLNFSQSLNISATNFGSYQGVGGGLFSLAATGSLGQYSGTSVSNVFFGGSAEVGSTVTIFYTYSVPEPITLLGSATAIALGAAFKRRAQRNLK
ncbi:MAG: PEP-CTERM sorting domain-containing protein [Snowella sp.]|nr:PEP-CTERM sorting domain-containing protein [Snowella sp.]